MHVSGHVLWREEDSRPAVWSAGTWEVRDGVIRRAPDSRVASHPDATDLTGWVVPGLVDVHCHIGIGARGPVARDGQVAQAMADRDSGVTLVRDCGVPVDTSWLQGRRDLPVLLRCGRHLARTRRYAQGLAVEVAPEDLPASVAAQAGLGDGWVKIVADWIDRSDGAESDLVPAWPLTVLVEAVAAAHGSGARVAAHAFSHAAVDDLLEAGVDDIEHGSGMDDDQMAEAARRGIAVTPTLLQVELFSQFAEQAGAKYPVYAATMTAMHARRRDHAERLFDSGVVVLPGTDAGGYQAHGCLPRELAAWVDVGVDPGRVLDLATWRARDFLGAPSLSEGAPADLVVYGSDPRADPRVLAAPAAVVLGGRRITPSQSPAVDPGQCA